MPALKNPKHERFAQEIASGSSAAAAHRVAYGSTGKASESNGCRLIKSDKVSIRIAELLVKFDKKFEAQADKQAEKRFLTLADKRAFLARVVNTAIGEVDEKSNLCQSAEYSIQGNKFKMPDKLRALELDAKLARELGGDPMVSVEVKTSVSVTITQERQAELAQAHRDTIVALGLS